MVSALLVLLLAAGAAPAEGFGRVQGKLLDAVTDRPVRGAAVIALDGQRELRVALSDERGNFELEALPARALTLVVQHPSYQPFTQPAVAVAAGKTTAVEIRVPPSAIEGETVEIVETTEEALHASLIRQEDFLFTAGFERAHAGRELTGRYRVCAGTDGNIALVVPLEPVEDADANVRYGISTGWQYGPLPAPACFNWRVTIRFFKGRRARLSPK
jgi:hypothetical protein